MPSVDTVPQTTGDFSQLKYIIEVQVREVGAKKILELGTDVGDSTRIFSNVLLETSGKLLTIDIVPPKEDWPTQHPCPNVMFVTGDSLKVDFAEEVDILFIDSNHHKEHVLEELRRYGKWVRKGGRILLHDIIHSEFGVGISEAITEWCKEVNIPTWERYEIQHGLGVIKIP